MSATTRSGARLRCHQHGFTFRLAAITPADLAQKKCAVCGHPIHDDAAYIKTEELILYCGKRCKATARRRRRGIPIGRSTAWRSVYERARSAEGAEVAVACDDIGAASRLAGMFRQRRDFDARNEGATVFVWLVRAV